MRIPVEYDGRHVECHVCAIILLSVPDVSLCDQAEVVAQEMRIA
jgi:hypothetical protein